MEWQAFLIAAAAAVCGYLAGGINGAIILSRLVYGKNIREMGSGNPGFTNFVRVFGLSPISVSVMLIDILKTALPVWLFSSLGAQYFGPSVAAAFTGLCCMLGHAFPIWYGFDGGKTFIAWVTAIWFVNAEAAAVVTAIFILLLFTVKYMSLASITAAFLFPVMLAIFGGSVSAVILSAAGTLLLIYRHKANIGRLINKTEPKFSFRKKGVSDQ